MKTKVKAQPIKFSAWEDQSNGSISRRQYKALCQELTKYGNRIKQKAGIRNTPSDDGSRTGK